MRQGNGQVAAPRRFLAVLAVPFLVAAVAASSTAYAQRFQGGAGSPDPGIGGTTGSPGIGDVGPLGGGATAGVGAAAGAGAAAGTVAPTSPGAAPRARSNAAPNTGATVLSPLPPPSVSGSTPLGGSPGGLSGSAAMYGGLSSGSSAGIGSTPSGLGSSLGSSGLDSSGTSGFGGSSSIRNEPPALGGSQPPSNPACGTLTASTSCATGR